MNLCHATYWIKVVKYMQKYHKSLFATNHDYIMFLCDYKLIHEKKIIKSNLYEDKVYHEYCYKKNNEFIYIQLNNNKITNIHLVK